MQPMPVSQTNNRDHFGSFRFNHSYNKFLNRWLTHDDASLSTIAIHLCITNHAIAHWWTSILCKNIKFKAIKWICSFSFGCCKSVYQLRWCYANWLAQSHLMSSFPNPSHIQNNLSSFFRSCSFICSDFDVDERYRLNDKRINMLARHICREIYKLHPKLGAMAINLQIVVNHLYFSLSFWADAPIMFVINETRMAAHEPASQPYESKPICLQSAIRIRTHAHISKSVSFSIWLFSRHAFVERCFVLFCFVSFN